MTERPTHENQTTPSPSQPGELPRAQIHMAFPAKKPIVSYVLMGITIFVFFLQQASLFQFSGIDLPAIYGMKINSHILQGQYWRLLTPVFLHGSVLHILFNMYALYIFGQGLERQFGHVRFTVLYFAAGFAGNVFSFIFTDANSLGSSTAVFGLLGAQAVFLYLNQKILGPRAKQGLSQIIMIGVINLIIGLQPGIDNFGHLGGLAAGVIFTFLAGPVLKIEGTHPQYTLQDTRPARETAIAGILIAIIFTAFAVLSVWMD